MNFAHSPFALRLAALSSVRYLFRRPWQLALCLTGLALGVAVVVAIELCIDSSKRALALSNERVSGNISHQIVGGPHGVPESTFRTLAFDFAEIAALPVIEIRAEHDRAPVTVLGIDPISQYSFAQRAARAGEGVGDPQTLVSLLIDAGTAALEADFAARLGVTKNDVLTLRTETRTVHLKVVGKLRVTDALAKEALSGVVLTDISTAQESFSMLGRLSRIDLAMRADQDALLATLRASLPSDLRIIDVEQRLQQTSSMTSAFELNLFMLSLLALMVGMFLVYNAVSFSIIQRRTLIGSFRTLGMTRTELLALVLVEVAVVALIGSALGLGLGVFLASQLLSLVTRTINDLYFSVEVSRLSIAPISLLKVGLLGWCAGVVAALGPALEALYVTPRAALSRTHLEGTARRLSPRAAMAGVVLLGLSGCLLWFPSKSLTNAFVELFAVVIGFALVVPLLTQAALEAARTVSRWFCGYLPSMALGGASRGLSRTGVASAALTVALASVIGVGIMVGSFRGSVEDWLNTTLRADFYLRTASEEEGVGQALIEKVKNLPEVAEVSFGSSMTVATDDGDIILTALKMASASYAAFTLTQGDVASAWSAFDNERAVLISEPLAWHRSLNVGDNIELRTDSRLRAFKIAGVYRDYASERGSVLMNRTTFEQYWRDHKVRTIGAYTALGSTHAALRTGLEQLVAAEGGLTLRSNRAIREASLDVFDRTFTITHVLRLLATVVACVGILSALMALALERAKEIAVLRAQGLTRTEVWVLVQVQNGALGIVCGILALPLGLLMAVMLTQVINRRSFGWTMQLQVDPAILLEAVVLALLTALAAGIYPAFKMAGTSPALALRED